MKKYLILVFCLVLNSFASAQDSPYALLYRPSFEMLEEHWKEGSDKVIFDYAAENIPLDTLWYDSDTNLIPSEHGLYMIIYVSRSELKYQFINHTPLSLLSIRSGNKISFKLLDEENMCFIDNAIIIDKYKEEIQYDPKEAAYTLRKLFKKNGTVLVKSGNYLAIIDWDLNKDRYEQPIIYKWEEFWYKLRWAREDRSRERQAYYSKGMNYLALNKPMYRVEDTLKLKAMILKKNGKAFKKNVMLHIEYYDPIKRKNVSGILDTISNYRPGGYKYQFSIADSLLGKNIRLMIKTLDDELLLTRNFRVEDYTLKIVKFTAEVLGEKLVNRPNVPIRISYSVLNDLGLSPMEGHLKVEVSVSHMETPLLNPVMIIPDLLIDSVIPIDVSGKGIVNLPYKRLPKNKAMLRINVQYVSANGETSKENWYKKWDPKSRSIKLDYSNGHWNIKADSTFRMKPNSELQLIVKDVIPGVLNYGKTQFRHQKNKIELPYSFKTKMPENWSLELDGIEIFKFQKENLSSQSAFLDYAITKDSLKIFGSGADAHLIYVEVYEKSKRRAYSGILGADTLSLSKDIDYYNIFYKELVKDDSYPFQILPIIIDSKSKGGAELLNLNVKGPERIYPGQTANWELQLSDDKPVKDFDILALAYKKDQFENNLGEYSAGVIESGIKRPKYKSKKGLKKRGIIEKEARGKGRQNLTKTWLQDLGADSLGIYKFMFPDNGLLLDYQDLPNGQKKPQFSPFVFNGGQQLAVQAFYIDGVVAYINGVTNWAYSSIAEKGSHEIKIRLSDRLITIPNVFFKESMKLEIGLDVCHLPDSVSSEEREDKYSQEELTGLSKYVLVFEGNRPYGSYLRQGSLVANLKNYGVEKYGPFKEESIVFGTTDRPYNFNYDPSYAYKFLEKEGAFQKRVKRNWDIYIPFVQNPRLGNLNDQMPGQLIQIGKEKKLSIYEKFEIGVMHTPSEPSKTSGSIDLLRSNRDMKLVYAYHYGTSTLYSLRSKSYSIHNNWPQGSYKILALSENYFWMIDSVQVEKQNTTYLDMNQIKKLPISKGFEVLSKLQQTNAHYHDNIEVPVPNSAVGVENRTKGTFNELSGVVLDRETMEAIPFANILLYRGRTVVGSTSSNLEGVFTISQIQSGYYTIECSLVGMSTIVIENLFLQSGLSKNLKFHLQKSSSIAFAAEVIYYYPLIEKGKTGTVTTSEDIVNMAVRDITSVAAQTAGIVVSNNGETNIRGSRGEGTVHFIDGVKVRGAVKTPRTALAFDLIGSSNTDSTKEESTEVLNQLALEGGNMRTNFKDYAFFIPDLTTDEHGKVSFEVKYPDDIANWSTSFIGMAEGNRYARKNVNTLAYTEIQSFLSTPVYLREGDSSVIIGKTLNYLDTALNVQNHFVLNGTEVMDSSGLIQDFNIHSLGVKAKDSLRISYSLKLNNGFKDGEERTIKVLPLGLEKNEGSFWMLSGDTTVSFEAAEKTEIHLGIMKTSTELLLEEVNLQLNYLHSCNEQLSSKLRALLAIQDIDLAANRRAADKREIRKIIAQLLKNRNDNDLWGWWAGQGINVWMSAYVVESLIDAQNHGFEVGIESSINHAIYILSSLEKDEYVNVLYALNNDGSNLETEALLKQIPLDSLSTSAQLKYAILAARKGVKYDTSAIQSLFQKDLLGNDFIDGNSKFNLSSKAYNTMLGARYLLENGDSLRAKSCLTYLLLDRQRSSFNTIDRAAFIDLLKLLRKGEAEMNSQVSVQTSEGESIAIEENETSKTFLASSLNIAKKGGGMAFVSISTKSFHKEPKRNDEVFDIEYSLAPKDPLEDTVRIGELAELKIKVKPKAEATYIMLEIPIPAGCSVENVSSSYYHSELKGDKLYVYLDQLRGELNLSISLLPRYEGKYTVNPIKAELMYFPVFNGNTEQYKLNVSKFQ